jgi:hypothetical protein
LLVGRRTQIISIRKHWARVQSIRRNGAILDLVAVWPAGTCAHGRPKDRSDVGGAVITGCFSLRRTSTEDCMRSGRKAQRKFPPDVSGFVEIAACRSLDSGAIASLNGSERQSANPGVGVITQNRRRRRDRRC